MNIKNKFYVVGSNTRDSLSPLIFDHWFKKYNINASYKPKQIKTNLFEKNIIKILNEKNLSGLNITIPYKEKIIKYLDKTDQHSKKIGAVNCVFFKNKKTIGTNTDWIGFGNALKENFQNQKNKKKKVVLIGFGGAAKSIFYYLIKQNYEKIHIFNRTPKKIKKTNVIFHPLNKLNKKHIDSASLIINSTPINVLSKFKTKDIRTPTKVFDIVYKPKETEFLKNFAIKKNKIYGISMLLHQAIPCFEIWFGFKPVIDQKLIKKLNKKILK